MNNPVSVFANFDTTMEQLLAVNQDKILTRATKLARAGHYSEAIRELDNVQFNEPKLAEESMLLKARIAAQQGQIEQASDHYSRVLKANPTHQGAGSGLAVISELTSKSWIVYLANNLIRMSVIVSLIALAFVIANDVSKREIQSVASILSSDIEGVQSSLQSVSSILSSDIEGVQSSLQKLTTQVDIAEAEIDRQMDLAQEKTGKLHNTIATRLDSLTDNFQEHALVPEITPSAGYSRNPFIDLDDYRSAIFRADALHELEMVRMSLAAWKANQIYNGRLNNTEKLDRLISEIGSFQNILQQADTESPNERDSGPSDFESEY